MSKGSEPSTEPQNLMAGLATELAGESDRTVAVLVSAHLDYIIASLLEVSMAVEASEVRNYLLHKPGNAPLGTFSARIDAAYCMGRINAKQRSDLHIIRNIRNDFAHKLVGISLNDQSLADRCRNLQEAHTDERLTDPRSCFIKAGVRLIVDITIEINRQKVARESARSGNDTTTGEN